MMMASPTQKVSSSTVPAGGMVTLRIDKLGRVVVPQAVRERLNLQPGTKLQLSFQNEDSIVLKVVAEDPVVERINGVPVIKVSTTAGFSILDAISRDREELIRKHMPPDWR